MMDLLYGWGEGVAVNRCPRVLRIGAEINGSSEPSNLPILIQRHEAHWGNQCTVVVSVVVEI